MTATTIAMTVTPAPCCPQCGFGLSLPPFEDTQAALLDAQQKIADLQAQVRLLNQKASAAVDRWADYEDELAQLRTQLSDSSAHSQSQQHSPTTISSSVPASPSKAAATSTNPSSLSGRTTISSSPSNNNNNNNPLPPPSPARTSFLPANAATRLSAFLSPRRSAPALKPLPLPPQQQQQQQQQQQARHGSYNNSNTTSRNNNSKNYPLGALSPSPFTNPNTNAYDITKLPIPLASPTPSTDELLEALSREQTLRLRAEGRLSDTSREVEELSVTLFEQANEMVAAERRARALLEERVETLERREAEKKKRLERLEGAMERIERVRKLLEETEGGWTGEKGGGDQGKGNRGSRRVEGNRGSTEVDGGNSRDVSKIEEEEEEDKGVLDDYYGGSSSDEERGDAEDEEEGVLVARQAPLPPPASAPASTPAPASPAPTAAGPPPSPPKPEVEQKSVLASVVEEAPGS
ncbi:hypothetical protein B0T17DRAFT_595754 [Bombardia bombarda]|uniref:GDP/GTP exchange factor Sec2 N-terminal domain-containing protein n=1 Tax=Bombardia bombarda TaxID=252184 RepID=A0AA40CG31_9PEZI|nr:hypothetical protein B0T17DRAFT_595754 [Bombardia bombarda]